MTDRKKKAGSREAHYEEEWSPTYGYRGLGDWALTRRAVENACANEGVELSREELNEGANIWFYSGVTLLFYDVQYGSGWDAFAAWFALTTGEKTPYFNEEELGNFYSGQCGRDPEHAAQQGVAQLSKSF